jgi:hypothetical protein
MTEEICKEILRTNNEITNLQRKKELKERKELLGQLREELGKD